jgi:hypothetical protein
VGVLGNEQWQADGKADQPKDARKAVNQQKKVAACSHVERMLCE